MIARLLLNCAVAVALSSLGTSARAAAQVDIYQFPDSQTEARYRGLIDEFRCPKCLNTNLAGSDAPIARDLRRTVHRLVVEEGFSDDQVRDFLQERYGDFVLYSPPFKPGTWILWLAPLGFVVLGAVVLARTVRRKDTLQLDASEQRRIAAIVGTQSTEAVNAGTNVGVNAADSGADIADSGAGSAEVAAQLEQDR